MLYCKNIMQIVVWQMSVVVPRLVRNPKWRLSGKQLKPRPDLLNWEKDEKAVLGLEGFIT